MRPEEATPRQGEGPAGRALREKLALGKLKKADGVEKSDRWFHALAWTSPPLPILGSGSGTGQVVVTLTA